ncbi:MAG: hypothetical protein AB7E30_10390 [Lawsonibacter sp.]
MGDVVSVNCTTATNKRKGHHRPSRALKNDRFASEAYLLKDGEKEAAASSGGS